MEMKLPTSFYNRHAEQVAQDLLGCTVIRTVRNKTYKAKIVETECYHGTNDPASRAFKGKNKISEIMWEHPGTIMIYNVHKYMMLNIVTGKHGEPSAVLIRALEPLNFDARCSGPGLLTLALHIDKSLHGLDITKNKNLAIHKKTTTPKIATSHRIGVSKDLEYHQRFFINKNPYVSKKHS